MDPPPSPAEGSWPRCQWWLRAPGPGTVPTVEILALPGAGTRHWAQQTGGRGGQLDWKRRVMPGTGIRGSGHGHHPWHPPTPPVSPYPTHSPQAPPWALPQPKMVWRGPTPDGGHDRGQSRCQDGGAHVPGVLLSPGGCQAHSPTSTPLPDPSGTPQNTAPPQSCRSHTPDTGERHQIYSQLGGLRDLPRDRAS